MSIPNSQVMRFEDIVVPEDRCRTDLGDLESLKDSIREIGLCNPITVTAKGVLVAGARRLQACKELPGWFEIPVMVIYDEEKAGRAEHDENECRKAFTTKERAVAYKRAKAAMGVKRGRPSKNTGKTGLGKMPAICGELNSKPPRLDEAARKAGAKNTAEAERIVRVAEHGSKSLLGAVDDTIVSLSDAESVCSEDATTQDEAVRRVMTGTAKTLKAAVSAIKAESQHLGDMAESVVDCRGVNVPDALRVYFDATPQFEVVAAKAREARLLLNKLDKHPIRSRGFASKNAGQLQSYFKTVEHDMEMERFGCVCPLCKGVEDGSPCKGCEKRRWLTVNAMNSFPWKVWKLSREGNPQTAKDSQ